MGGLPTVTPPFLMESGHKNREIVTSDVMYQNVDPDLYQNWLERKENGDYGYNFEDEKIWSVTQPVDGIKEKKNNVNITKDEVSDNDLSLPTVHQLATSVIR